MTLSYLKTKELREGVYPLHTSIFENKRVSGVGGDSGVSGVRESAGQQVSKLASLLSCSQVRESAVPSELGQRLLKR
jgi:hypothetical protein